MNPTVNRILHILGIAVAVVVPVLTAILTGLPATSKEAIIVAAVLGILSSLKGAFGTPDATATVTSASKGTADLLVTAGATPQKGDVVKIDPQTTRPGAGYPGKIGVLVFLVSSLLATAALAQTAPLDCGPLGVAVNSLNICIVPSTAGGQVFNLKTGSVTNIALLVGIAAIHQDNLSLGAGFYCGADLALSTPNGFMCAGLVSIKNYGAFGGGFSSYHDSLANQQIFQGLVMYAGTLHFGGTPSTLAARRDEKAAAELDYYVRGLKDGTALKSVGK